ncbi:DUF3307 domain-containing protein [Hirschia litorea]|uniref:DUF3307 domain-containing protein n=1 Tax=Hirschia litorea TaxID=1199156 RepID=A0ABW2IIE3_9PROT
MLELFIMLFAAHILADFVFQTKWLLQRKHHFVGMALHIAIVLGTTIAISGLLDWRILAIVGVSHFVMDFIKTRYLPDTLLSFTLDQCLHIGILVGLVWCFPNAFESSFWQFVSAENMQMAITGLVLILGAILSVRVGDIVIHKAMLPMEKQFEAEVKSKLEVGRKNKYSGLPNAPAMIGVLERFIIYLLIMVGQPTGVGFLIAAKSILRFAGAKSDDHDNRRAEYAASEMIIVGTLMSFGWAISISVLTLIALKMRGVNLVI